MGLLPDDGWSRAEVVSEFDGCVVEGEGDKVPGAIGRVAVVEQESVWIGGLEYDLHLRVGHDGASKSDELKVRMSVERRNLNVVL